MLATPRILTRSTPVLHGPKKSYQKIEKADLALAITSRRLCPYFQSNCVVVWTYLPIKQVL
ncbi:hypothetical protein CR513_29586, partial [Mucuna pruriens]